MKVQYICCAGLDVHKRIVVACVLKGAFGEEVTSKVKSFGTTTPELMEMIEWLKSCGATHVAMEATGNYWMPIYNLLEGHFELVVANAAHMKAVPGRKSDVQDAEWIAELLRHGLLRSSFIPSREQRDLRELTRHRSSLAGKRAQAANELQKSLESANIKLQSVVTDITGASSMEMLQELTNGKSNPKELAQLAKRRLRAKIPELEKALRGNLRRHHQMIIEQLLADIGLFAAQIAELDAYIENLLRQEQEIIDRLDDTPGINRRIAEIVIAEAGTDMNRFPNQYHFASWIGLCPGQNESAGKRKSGKTRKGNRALRSALVEAAHGAVRKKDSYYGAQYRRIAVRRGKKRALVAVAHSMAIAIYHMLKSKTPYRELGANFFDTINPVKALNRLTKRIESLGYHVSVTVADMAA
ncbi:MAG: IS110 family transposase [Terrimicrobiaceae bacterium]